MEIKNPEIKKSLDSIQKLIEVVKALRTPETGCPWDLEQDHKSLRPYMIEEAFEAVEAIDSEDDELICDELGDVLLQVILHGQIADDRGSFNVGNIADSITDKMIRRHPHVFGEQKVNSSEEVLKNWEAIKLEEDRKLNSQSNDELKFTNSLKKIPNTLPALLRAQRTGGKASKAGFDWNLGQGVLEKVKEEISELSEELKPILEGQSFENIELTDSNKQKIADELGDVLFSVSQLGRWLGLNSEDCLRESTKKFISRFEHMESNSPSDFESLDENSLIKLWNEAKKNHQ